MKTVILAAALVCSLALSACGGNSAAVSDWKQTARANCEKQADPIARQTCRERVEAVTTMRSENEDANRR